jgi:hypothetical protein
MWAVHHTLRDPQQSGYSRAWILAGKQGQPHRKLAKVPRCREIITMRLKSPTLVQPKHTPVTRVRKINPNAGLQVDRVAPSTKEFSSTPGVVAAPAAEEEPGTLLTSAMAMWGLGVTACVMIPVMTAALAGAPLIFAGQMLLRDSASPGTAAVDY